MEVFGEAWIMKHFWSHLMKQQSDISYLHRLTIQFGMVALAGKVSSETVKTSFMPVLTQMHKDPVANVRLNVAKTLQALNSPLKQNKESLEMAKSILNTL